MYCLFVVGGCGAVFDLGRVGTAVRLARSRVAQGRE